MNCIIGQLRRVRFQHAFDIVKVIPIDDRRHVNILKSRGFSFPAFSRGSIREKPNTKQSECLKGKIDLFCSHYQSRRILCRPFHVTHPSNYPNPVTLWVVSNIVTIGVAVLGHQVFLARRGKFRFSGGEAAEVKLMTFSAVVFSILSVCILGYYLTHIETSPVSGRRRFIAFSNEDMVEMTTYETRLIDLEFSKYYLNPSNSTFKRVQNVVARILTANRDISGVRERQWNLVVIDLPEIKNAFILPNGNMYVFTGILHLCKNDDEVGFVVSHELSHAVLEHLAEQMSHMYIGEFLFLLPVFLIWSNLPILTALAAHILARSCADVLFNLPFSRFSEVEADLIGIQLASKACFDPRLAILFWRKMMLTTDDELPWRYKIEWLSTHPSYETRAHHLERVIPNALKIRKDYNCPPLSSRPLFNEIDNTNEI